MKVLIVDNDEVVNIVEQTVGKTSGVTIETITDGKLANALLNDTAPPNMAVLNCSLKESKKIDWCKKIGELYPNYTRLILLSDQGAEKILQHFLANNRRGKSGSKAPIGTEQLTARQLEVLRLIANGYSNVKIAENLGVTTGTVKSHVNQILAKLGVANRTQAVAKALHEEWL